MIDTNDELVVTMQAYRPEVNCWTTTRQQSPSLAACSSALSFMPADKDLTQFGDLIPGQHATISQLPQSFYPRE